MRIGEGMADGRYIYSREFPRIMTKILRVMEPWPWCLIGGRSVEIWANPPQTPDVDILAAVKDHHVDAIARRFEKVGVRLVNVWDGLKDPTIFFKDEKLGVEIDLLSSADPMYTWILERARRMTIQGVTIPVATPEDIVIMKSRAACGIGRPKDKRGRDLAAINVISETDIDRDFISESLLQAGWNEERAFLLKNNI